VGAEWGGDPVGGLEDAVAAVGAVLGAAPDAVIVSGDVASNAADDEYAQARSVLDRLSAPVYVVPGNHDDRDALRRHFPSPPGDVETVSFAVSVGPARLVALDSTDPGQDGGRLDGHRLAWLEDTLEQARAVATLLVMHHPPLSTGVLAFDRFGIPVADRLALGKILARHPQVQMIAAGHVHRLVAGAIGSVPVLAIPSTDVQLGFDLTAPKLRFVREPPCFAVHTVADGRIVSHVQPVETSAI
jgi:3',5'-cyclic AMP phosphodiesterase CpdA